MEAPSAAVGRIKNRACRPVLGGLVVSSLLLGWRFHYTHAARATIRFTVALEGASGRVSPDVSLDGRRYEAKSPSGLGRKTVQIGAPGYESFGTNVFIWYAGAAFGDVTLARSRGRLDLEFSPAVESVFIRGSETNTRLNRITQGSLHLPTDRYSVVAKFARFSVERTVDVTRNQSTRVAITPSLATLNLASTPAGAEFELRSVKPPEIGLNGRTPVTISDLPSGAYSLVIWRGGSRKSRAITLGGTRATNDLTVDFPYAKVTVTSEPANATIHDGDVMVGRTPALLEFAPGPHTVRIEKEGHFGTNVSLTVAETDSRTVAVTLGNVSFISALARARNAASSSSPEYERAWGDVLNALEIKPGDEDALALKRSIEFKMHMRDAKLFQGTGGLETALMFTGKALELGVNDAEVLALKEELLKGQRAAEAKAEVRRNRPQKLLTEATASLEHDALFEPQILRFKGSLIALRSGVFRAFLRKPDFSIQQTDRAELEAIVIKAETKDRATPKTVVLVVGQTAESEVTVCFKLFGFVQGDIELGTFLPMHTRFAKEIPAAKIEEMRAKDISDFKERLMAELR